MVDKIILMAFGLFVNRKQGGGRKFKKRPVKRQTVLLGFANKFFPALGAGDGNFSLMAGNTHRLMTPGAVEMPMLFILQPFQKPQILPVFLVALVGVPGQAAENGPDHQAVAEDKKDQIQPPGLGPHRQQAGHQSGAENHHIQPVCTVSPRHKSPEKRRQF